MLTSMVGVLLALRCGEMDTMVGMLEWKDIGSLGWTGRRDEATMLLCKTIAS